MISKYLKKYSDFHKLSSVAYNVLMFVDHVFVVSYSVLHQNSGFSNNSYVLKLWNKIKIIFLLTILFFYPFSLFYRDQNFSAR